MPSFSSPFPFSQERRQTEKWKRRERKRPIFFRAPGNVSKTVAALLFFERKQSGFYFFLSAAKPTDQGEEGVVLLVVVVVVVGHT